MERKSKSAMRLSTAIFAGAFGALLGTLYLLCNRVTVLSSKAPPKKLSMVALDLDGTTLNTKHTISEANKAAIRGLVQRGIKVAIATGRSMSGIYEHLEALQLPSPIPVLCLNGALALRGSADGKTTQIFTDPVSPEHTEMVIDLADNHQKDGKPDPLLLQFYIDDKIYAVPKNDHHLELMKRYEALAGHPQERLEDIEALRKIGQPAKILVLTEDPDSLIETAKKRFGDNIHLVRGSPEPFFVEFLSKGVCKGTGLLKLCKVDGVDPKTIVAFGDGDNDMEFLEYSGMGCAMKNARQVTKDRADVVLEWTNDEDGVAKQLQRLQEQGILCPAEEEVKMK